MHPSLRAPLLATFAGTRIELVGDHALFFVPHLDELHAQLAAHCRELALCVEAVVSYGRVDGYAHVYGEPVYRLQHEGEAGEGEGVEVSLFIVEDYVEDAWL